MTKSDSLKVGDEAKADVHLKMVGGYGDEFLVPGEPDDGNPGVILIQKGDTITRTMIKRLKAAEDNTPTAKKTASKRASAKPDSDPGKVEGAPLSSTTDDGGPAKGVGVKTAE